VVPLYVVVPPRMLMLDLAGPIEVVRRANTCQAEVRFEVHHVGPRLLAARAGLLDGYSCTTHHQCCAELDGRPHDVVVKVPAP
jgi:transcriptional regulator GlxA family with amidase domain